MEVFASDDDVAFESSRHCEVYTESKIGFYSTFGVGVFKGIEAVTDFCIEE